MEEWKDLEGYNWIYKISNLWRFKSFKCFNDWRYLKIGVLQRVKYGSMVLPINIERYKEELDIICKKYGLLLKEEVLTTRRDKYIQKWRSHCMLSLKQKGLSYENIWRLFNARNHAAVLYSIRTYFPIEYSKLRINK